MDRDTNQTHLSVHSYVSAHITWQTGRQKRRWQHESRWEQRGGHLHAIWNLWRERKRTRKISRIILVVIWHHINIHFIWFGNGRTDWVSRQRVGWRWTIPKQQTRLIQAQENHRVQKPLKTESESLPLEIINLSEDWWKKRWWTAGVDGMVRRWEEQMEKPRPWQVRQESETLQKLTKSNRSWQKMQRFKQVPLAVFSVSCRDVS